MIDDNIILLGYLFWTLAGFGIGRLVYYRRPRLEFVPGKNGESGTWKTDGTQEMVQRAVASAEVGEIVTLAPGTFAYQAFPQK